MKPVRIYFRITDMPDFDCLDTCPFGKLCKVGSVSCQKCEHCFGIGIQPSWFLSMEKGMNFGRGYVHCNLCYKGRVFRIRHFIHTVKLSLKKAEDFLYWKYFWKYRKIKDRFKKFIKKQS
jgi:hypothetical protein